MIGQNFHVLASVDSTNNYAMAQVHKGTALHGETYFALEQTAGRGQREKKWITTAGENILMSTVLYPAPRLFTDLPLLNMAVALSCYNLLESLAQEKIKIKWPNDLYWNDRKAGGILIENGFQGSQWQFAIVGIGLNINQVVFPPHLPNPVSMKQVLGYDLDVIQLAGKLCTLLQTNYGRLLQGEADALLTNYNKALYKHHETVRLRQGNVVFPARIEGVDKQGSLLVESSVADRFQTGEVEWVQEVG
ncbi:MAG: biotin--[acetyl-CoA-carboxylase] ligase [Williamsia sp.]|nr:biotin--[acetyl-CoA-carboxylase] ligase [Williamsia sp.]